MRIVLNIPHSSSAFPDLSEFEKWSDSEMLEIYMHAWTDWHTCELFSRPGLTSVVYPYSRFYMDVERLWDDPLEKIEQGVVYTDFHGIRRRVNKLDYEKEYMEHMEKYRSAGLGENCVLVDCHSFPSSVAENVDICIGFNNDGSFDKNIVDCVCKTFEKSGYRVSMNFPYSNSLTPLNPIDYKSIMIEVNKKLYMDEDTLEKTDGYMKLYKVIDLAYKSIDVL